MDGESELQLYDHIDFSDSNADNTVQRQNNDGNAEQKRGKRITPKKATQAQKPPQRRGETFNAPAIQQTLSGSELLFFPNLRVEETPHATDDVKRRKNYLIKLKKMTPIQKRLHRANRDLRYLHKNATKEPEETQPQQFCYDHLTGYCARDTCNRWHQMREPRIFGVCKFYLTGTCTKGNSCEFMHSDFPCRFYYLNISHPSNSDEQKCRFQHGGPLPKRMIGFFLKHIEHWARKLTQCRPHEFEKCFEDYKRRFDERQENLVIEYTPQIHPLHVAEKTQDKAELSFEKIFNQRQIELLSGDGYINLSQVNSLPVEVLTEKYKLTMDQIYEISIICANVQDPQNSNTEDLDVGNDYVHSLYKEHIENDEATGCVDKNSVSDSCKVDLDCPKEIANRKFFIESPSLLKEIGEHNTCQVGNIVSDKSDFPIKPTGDDLNKQSLSNDSNNEDFSHNLHEESLDDSPLKTLDNHLAMQHTEHDSDPDSKLKATMPSEPQTNPLKISETEICDKSPENESMDTDEPPPNANNSELESDLFLSDSADGSDSDSDDNLVINEED